MLLATTTVADFDRFMKVFANAGAEKRKKHGSKGALKEAGHTSKPQALTLAAECEA